ncbi:alpha/beta fold hydrolase [Bradyrhizobium manausense]|uniref:alpha/beta fold hydrolase n=1 Tax=Bradyrhizobium manausense TaxID=989370 RepID=UPI001BA54F51|nr:alpha/beta fold hydrolase [Bradyrhizobium manausense]MBR1086661.1 alpha/beta fold hydrolase [Bradyrhizobium manausense]
MRTALVAIGVGLGLATLLGCGFVVWALDTYKAEPIAEASALNDPGVVIGERDGFLVIRPSTVPSAIGLLFYPGLRIEPKAYLSKLAALSSNARVNIVIGRPRLNVAAFSIGQADDMRRQLTGIKQWYVAGHSLGGAVACYYARNHLDDLQGVVLLGTYCGSDISASRLRVLTIAAGNDGVMPPETIAQHSGELPAGARIVRIAGMAHSQFGNYGPQSGDGRPSINDDQAREAIFEAARAFFHQQPDGALGALLR